MSDRYSEGPKEQTEDIIEDIETAEQLTKRVARGGGIVFIGSMIGKATKFLLELLLGRFLGASTYGIYALGYSVIMIAQQFSTLGLQNGIVRFGALYKGEKDTSRVKGIVISALSISTGASIIVAIVLFTFSRLISVKVFNQPDLVNVLRLFAISLPFYVLMLMSCAGARAFQKVEYDTLTKDIFQPFLNVILVGVLFLSGYRLFGAVFGFLSSAVLSAFFGLNFVRKIFPELISELKPSYEIKKLLRFSIPVFLTGFSGVLIMQIDKVMLGLFEAAKDIGVYNAAFRAGGETVIFLASFNAIFAPIIADLYNKGDTRHLGNLFRTVTRWIVALSLPLFLIMAIYSREIMGLFGREFIAGWSILVILSFANLINASVGSVGYMLQMSGHQDIELVNNLVVVAINIGLNIVFILKWGALGAALATGLSIIIINLAKLIEVKQILHIQPYDKKYIKPFIACLISTIFGMLFKVFIGSDNGIWLLGLVGILIIYGVILILLGLDKEDRIILEAIKKKWF